MRNLIVSIVLFGFTFGAQAQQEGTVITWKTLTDVKFTEKYVEKYQDWFLFPNFGPQVKSLDGQNVAIKGYVIPIDLEEGLYALSAFPFAACFFCGAAGPESVMTLNIKQAKRKYNTDDVVTFKGKLRLNDSNIEDFNYILDNAEEVKFHY
ncbi:MAG: DUF3299 domain-containing protein [Cryomorphaceae bacterium]|nr:DUF3299 domain-containing protein [Cryomorphaceae bacterium]